MKPVSTGAVWIGTSNVHLPGNKLTFPPEYQLKSRLHYYSSILNSVEVNSCFYKTPQQTTFEKWARDVPEDFRFTLKLSKDITHAKELCYDIACMDKFLQAATGIGHKKGCLLIQFPGKISLAHFNQVEQILTELHEYDPKHEWRKAIEFRNSSWYIRETIELLDEYEAALVYQDFSKAKTPSIEGNANFVYIRMHGPTGNYRDSYSDHTLNEVAEKIRQIQLQRKDVYVYFNNTAGNAFENARALQSRIYQSH